MSKSKSIRAIPVLKENLGLSKTEALVLLPVIRGGNMTAGGVALILNEGLDKVERALKRLEKKGLVEPIEGVVTIYRAILPLTAISESVSTLITQLEEISVSKTEELKSHAEKTDQMVESLLDSYEAADSELQGIYTDYEEGILHKLKSTVDAVVSSTNKTLNEYNEELSKILSGLDEGLEETIGTDLAELHAELDATQNQLKEQNDALAKEYDQSLEHDQKEVKTSVAELKKRTDAFINAAKNAVIKATSETLASLRSTTEEIQSKMDAHALETSNEISEILMLLSENLKSKTTEAETDLSQASIEAQASLEEVISTAREFNRRHADLTKKRIESAIATTVDTDEGIDAWKEEVTSQVETTQQSMRSQLDQLANGQNSFHEVMRSIISGHLDRVSATTTEEHTELRSMARGISSNTELFINEARSNVAGLLNKQAEAQTVRLEQTSKKLDADLEKWGSKAGRNIDKKVQGATKEISSVLENESNELGKLAESFTNRVKSSFSGVRSSTATRNEAILSKIEVSTNEYETSINSVLDEITQEYLTSAQKQVGKAETVYDMLNAKLNERLAESVSTIDSHYARVQKEVDQTISEQVSRIDSHAEEMRGELHIQLEDITRQFISLTQSIESTFNGLLSSQAVEARNMISSAHTEFKNSLKSEMESLDEDSIKLQQEFASEVGLRVDKVKDNLAAMRRMLDEFTTEKKQDISKSSEMVLQEINGGLSETEESLAELEASTVRHFGDNLVKVSKEFHTSVLGARDNVSGRLSSLGQETEDILTKNSTGVRNTIDSYISGEQESWQRVLSDTSKKMDNVAGEVIQSTSEKIGEYQQSLTDREEEVLAAHESARDEVLSSIDERKVESRKAIESSSSYINKTTKNVSSSVNELATKLNGDIAVMRQGLQKSADESLESLNEFGESQAGQLETIVQNMLSKNEGRVRATLDNFSSTSDASINQTMDELANVAEATSQLVSESLIEIISPAREEVEQAEDDMKAGFVEVAALADTTAEEFESLLKRIVAQMTRSRRTLFENTQQNVMLANQKAARKFESIGLDLKAEFSSKAYGINEEIRNSVSAKIDNLSKTGEGAMADMTESTSNLREIRSEKFTSTRNESTADFKDWAASRKQTLTKIRTSLQDAIKKAKTAGTNTVNSIEAINEAGKELALIPTKDTWYISGEEEACAHMQDMANRAENSVLLSVFSTDCLDLKKLSRIKEPGRRILVVPESDEPSPELDVLKGWRIWQTSVPMALAVIDSREILLGGALQEDQLFIVSRDQSYLNLYRDVIGPKMITSRKELKT
ncbi:hypothetical protein EU537_02535 [Candidatus Thorarchaeota archaeon]|nr:MAG: hypothetical protein EU537_02535 [Candidatus Thorarchaeota archaeon]